MCQFILEITFFFFGWVGACITVVSQRLTVFIHGLSRDLGPLNDVETFKTMEIPRLGLNVVCVMAMHLLGAMEE